PDRAARAQHHEDGAVRGSTRGGRAGGGGDRRGRGARQGVLRRRRTGVRQRHPGRGPGRGRRRRLMAALEGVEGLLLDLSGVIYVQDEAVPGAAEALKRFRSGGIPVRLVTNTTMSPRRTILERLERLGIEADPAELITPASLARRRCEEAGYESV